MSLESRSILLNNEREMPMLGLGVYKATGSNEVENAICYAVEAGYRLIDTASAYKNEEGVGRGIKAAPVKREDLFVTTKVWNNAQRMNDVEGAFNRSLERLGLDYVDLYLIHWPVAGCYINTWKELEKIYASGRAKAIGVSNFSVQDLENLRTQCDIVPAVNQIEFHPLFQHPSLLTYCQSHGIAVQAYAPLARGAYLDEEAVVQIASAKGKTPAQIGLRWSVQQGVSVIPKSTQKERIISNSQIFDFSLTQEEMQTLNALDRQQRTASIPEDLLSQYESTPK